LRLSGRFSLSLEKKEMKRFLCAAVMITAVSCGLTEVGEPVRRPGGEVWTGPGVNVGKDDPDRTVCYVTLMSYPDGYDWRADRQKGSVKCSLVVLANGLPMMKVPVGDEHEISSDPDMHRVIDGHLYTDYSTDSETVIKKDGRLLFRYLGKEHIFGMLVDSSGVYTLGHSRDGAGFTYRRNGEILLERAEGRSFGRLYRDGDDICFAFSEQVASSAEEIERYYHVRNGEVSQVALREDVKKVWCVTSDDGVIYYVADIIGVDDPVVFAGSSMTVLDMPESASMAGCRILADSGVVCVEGVSVAQGRPLSAFVWTAAMEYYAFKTGLTMSSINCSGGSVFCVLNSLSSSICGQVYLNGTIVSTPFNYISMSSRTAVMADGILHVGLSSKSGAKPQIWKDGKLEKLDYNGYICSVTTNKDQDSQETVLD
jgi:hypothetical protein